MFQQRALAVEAPAVSGQISVCPHDTMARNDN
jgi:hypothetical protein